MSWQRKWAPVDVLKLWLDAALGRRALLAAEIARAPGGTEAESAPPSDD